MENDEKISSAEPYYGFEQGPIRPPSEAYSLLIRVTRNCPYNRCTFCPVYKGTRFTQRPVHHVISDIDLIYKYIVIFQNSPEKDFRNFAKEIPHDEELAFIAAANWYFAGEMKSVFLQDADSLIKKPAEIVEILKHLKTRFPEIQRITSYARSQTITRISDQDMKAIRDNGLNRVHIGMESGSDEILKRVIKGSTKAMHIEAGLKVKGAGIELSEYYIPGLGGSDLWELHAKETADAMNRINPDFIRLRTLAVPEIVPLYQDLLSGHFKKCSDTGIVKEILLFLDTLDGIQSYITSDHILNLFSDFEGHFPDEKIRLRKILTDFLELSEENRMIYQVGRRKGIFHTLADMTDTRKISRVKRFCEEQGITPENITEITDKIMQRFI